MNELIGAGVAALSAFLYDVGYVLEKQALSDLPPVRLGVASVLQTALSSRRWVAGFVAMLAGLGLQVVALTLAPVSVVQPILAGGLIALAAAGSSVLGETLSRRQVLALGLVVAAVVAVAGSARHGSDLSRTVSGGRFLVMALVVGAAAALAARGGKAGRGGLAGSSLAAGLLYGLGAVAEKAVSTQLVSKGVISGAWASIGTPYPWVFLAATLAGLVVFQVGLQAQPASLMASLTNVTSTVCALIGAGAVFDEALLPAGPWSVLRLAGFAFVLSSVALLAFNGESPAAGPGRARPDHAVAP